MILPALPSVGNAPACVRTILRRGRRAYHRMPVNWRPALNCLTSAVGLFKIGELFTLAKANAWPLSAEALAYIATAPAERRRMIRRADRRLLAALLRVCLSRPETVRKILALANEEAFA